VAKEIAKRLNITYLDTGAMYRAVTLFALRNHADVCRAESLKSIVDTIDLDITPTQIFVAGEDVSEAIRTPEITRNVSFVSMDAYVRERMVALQQKIAHGKSVIMDGRDIGTTVLPDASYKFFLIADPVERAKRRKLELDAKGFETTIEALTLEIIARDKLDSEREVSPLKRAVDAVELDTTFMTIEEVVQTIIAYVEKHQG
jgi:cytidylate kinase